MTPESVHQFWFADALTSEQNAKARSKQWFQANAEFDQEIEREFGRLPDLAAAHELDDWLDSPRGGLALIIGLDQFPRNMYRGTPRAFEYDTHSQALCLRLLEQGYDNIIDPVEAVFMYLPLEHAEDRELQTRSISTFESLMARVEESQRQQFQGYLTYAQDHAKVINEFGRFPHRNKILGRKTTPAEKEYLESGGQTFGGQARFQR